MNNLEIIKNILLSLVSIVAFVGLMIFYMKIYFNVKKIKIINKEIEKTQTKLDQNEIDNIKGVYAIDIDVNGNQQKYKRKLEQNTQKLRREKEYLLEEISIFKIFKK